MVCLVPTYNMLFVTNVPLENILGGILPRNARTVNPANTKTNMELWQCTIQNCLVKIAKSVSFSTNTIVVRQMKIIVKTVKQVSLARLWQ